MRILSERRFKIFFSFSKRVILGDPLSGSLLSNESRLIFAILSIFFLRIVGELVLLEAKAPKLSEFY